MTSNRFNYIGKNVVTVHENISYPAGVYVEYDLKLWKSKQTTSESFLESEWDLIIGDQITGGTSGTTIGVWSTIPNQPSVISNVQIPLEYRLDSNPNSELVLLRGQFGIESTYGSQSLLVGTLPSVARPEERLRVVNKSTAASPPTLLEIRPDGDIYLLYSNGIQTTPIGQITETPHILNNVFFRPVSSASSNSSLTLGAEGNTPQEACNNRDNETNFRNTLGDIGDTLSIAVGGNNGYFFVKDASSNLVDRIGSIVQVNDNEEIVSYDSTTCASGGTTTTTTTSTTTTTTTTTTGVNPPMFVSLVNSLSSETNVNQITPDFSTIRLLITSDAVDTQNGLAGSILPNNEPISINIQPIVGSPTTFRFLSSVNLSIDPPIDGNFYNSLTLNTDIIAGNSYAYIDFRVNGTGTTTGFNVNVTNSNNKLGETSDTSDGSYVLKTDPSVQTTYGYTLINNNAITIFQAAILS